MEDFHSIYFKKIVQVNNSTEQYGTGTKWKNEMKTFQFQQCHDNQHISAQNWVQRKNILGLHVQNNAVMIRHG